MWYNSGALDREIASVEQELLQLEPGNQAETEPAEFEAEGAMAEKEFKKAVPVRHVTKATRPPTELSGRGSCPPFRDPHRTFTANEPMRESHFFPNDLRPRLALAKTDAGKDLPLVSQTRQRVRQIFSPVGPSVGAAARNGPLQPDWALRALEDLLDCLSDYYYEHSYSNRESYDRKLKREITASEEWRGFLKELAELAEAPKLHAGQESDPKATATTKSR